MLTILAFAIVIAISLVIFAWENTNNFEKVFVAGLGLLIGAMIGIIVAVIIGAATAEIKTEKIETETIKLVAVNGKNEYSGAFFLASGSFQGDMYYVFYYEEADGAIKFGKIRAGNASIYEEENRKDGELETRKTIKTFSSSRWGIERSNVEEIVNIFHVPKGTIKRELKLNFQ